MTFTHLDSSSDKFDDIVQHIKDHFLSKNSYPKLILGTGLSRTYNLPGMKELGEELKREFDLSSDSDIKDLWLKKEKHIFEYGLEEGLKDLNLSYPIQRKFVTLTKEITAKFILNEELDKINEIYNNQGGFYKLLKYLRDSVSTNNPILDVMTPNYDRVIELVSDKLGIRVFSGFSGEVFSNFDCANLRNPRNIFNTKEFLLRLFKPHGSLNWINKSDILISTNDSKFLLNEYKNIDIVTPGSSKYEISLINPTYNGIRECFNSQLNDSKPFSMLFFGYGFNDEHFNSTLYARFETTPTLIISKFIKPEIIDMAHKNKNLIIICEIDNKNILIYKKTKYETKEQLWNLDIFTDIMIA